MSIDIYTLLLTNIASFVLGAGAFFVAIIVLDIEICKRKKEPKQ